MEDAGLLITGVLRDCESSSIVGSLKDIGTGKMYVEKIAALPSFFPWKYALRNVLV